MKLFLILTFALSSITFSFAEEAAEKKHLEVVGELQSLMAKGYAFSGTIPERRMPCFTHSAYSEFDNTYLLFVTYPTRDYHTIKIVLRDEKRKYRILNKTENSIVSKSYFASNGSEVTFSEGNGKRKLIITDAGLTFGCEKND